MVAEVPDVLNVWALDGLDRIDDAGEYLSLLAVERDLRAGEWSLELPFDSSAAQELRAATWPGIEIYDPRDDSRFGGFVTRRGVRKAGQGPKVAWFRGLDFQGWLQGWLSWPNTTDVNLFWQRVIGSGSTLTGSIHTSASFNLGPSALAERQMPDLEGVQLNDPDAGPSPTYWIEGQPLLELWRGWATGTDYTVRLRLDRPSVGGGRLLFETPLRGTAGKYYDIETGSLQDYDAAEIAALASRAIGMGDDDPGGDPGARFVSNQQITPVDWRSRYWEVMRDRAGLGQAELDQETADWLVELGATESIDVSEVDATGWGQEIDLGWKIDFKLDPETVVSSTVASTTLRGESGVENRTVSIGSEALTANELALDRLTAIAYRVKRLEREGTRT